MLRKKKSTTDSISSFEDLSREAVTMGQYAGRKNGFRGVLFYTYKDSKDELGNPPDRETLKKLDGQEDEEHRVIRNTNSACFAQFTYNSERYNDFMKGRDRLTYFVPKNVPTAFDKNEKDIERYLKGAIEAKLLPPYVDAEAAAKNLGVTIRLDQKDPELSPSLLFIYLSLFRDLDEYTKVVVLTLKAIDIFGLDFLTAYVLAHRLNGTPGHSPFSISLYRSAPDSVPLNYLMGLKRYLDNPTKYDDRSILLAKRGKAFEAGERITGAFKTEIEVSMKYLTDPKFIELMNNEKSKVKDFKQFKA